VARMGSVTHPRGRLPRRVYWVRRLIALGVALLLVFAISKLLGGTGVDDPGSAIEASNSSADQQHSSAPSVSMGPVAPSTKLRSRAKVPLAPPSGVCLDDDVSVLPSVPHAWAGGSIVIRLQLQGTQPACTFDVSPESLVVKIVSGSDRIWSSQDCPATIPKTQVVVRSALPVEVPVTWSGRRSDDQCTSSVGWAMTGFYHVYAAALGSTPTDVQFEVTHAPTFHQTQTAKPKPSQSASAAVSAKPTDKASPRH
jgi:hypothetical protein